MCTAEDYRSEESREKHKRRKDRGKRKGAPGNKFAIITAFLGETRNRYMVYQGNRTLAEKFEVAKTIPGLDGFELCYPADFENSAKTLPYLYSLL
jgi:hypothetical protein